MSDRDNITLHKSDCALLLGGYQCTCGFHQRNSKTLPALAVEPTKKTPAWWMDGLATTLMREGVNKHRAREIAAAYWDAYCQIPGNEEEPT